MEKVSASITVPLRPTTVAKLRAQANAEGRTPAAMARYAIEHYLRSKQRPAWEEDTRGDPANA